MRVLWSEWPRIREKLVAGVAILLFDFDGTLAEGKITAENLQGELKGKPLGALIEKFDAGEAYANIHTKAKPAGEVRGQIHK